jgi:hypothetical protein
MGSVAGMEARTLGEIATRVPARTDGIQIDGIGQRLGTTTGIPIVDGT